MLRLLLYISILAGSQAFFFSRSPDWDKLQVTFGINVFSSGTFSHLPRTVLAARDEGFTELSGCGATPMFAGRRFAKNGDLAVVLIFDVNGIIAGIQAGFSSNQYNGSPDDPIRNHPFVEYDHHQFVTAYFTDPGSICSRGRTSDQYSEEGTGTRLLIQNGTTPREYITIPMTETGIRTTRWTRGKCFPWMGVHYWYDISRDMDCGRFFPVFLMYNGGKLNSFGWAFNADLTSPRYEHPPSSQFRVGTYLVSWTLALFLQHGPRIKETQLSVFRTVDPAQAPTQCLKSSVTSLPSSLVKKHDGQPEFNSKHDC